VVNVQAQTTEGRELEEGNQESNKFETVSGEEERSSYEEEGPWYLGKAREEFHKRRHGQLGGRRGEEEDPIQVRLYPLSPPPLDLHFLQWARDRRNAEHERDSDFGPEDYFEGAMRGGQRGEENIDEFWETILLVLLCLAVSILLYVRTRMVDRMRRRDQQPQQGGENEQPQPPANGGVFPPPGDPARNEWAVLR